MITIRRKVAITIFTFLMLALSQVAARPAIAEDSMKVRIGWQPAAEVPLYIAQEDKLFEEAGFAPEYVRFNAGPPMFAALGAGDIDIAYMGAPPAVIAMAEDLPVQWILTGEDQASGEGLVVRPEAGIETIADLKGKTIGVWRGTSAEMGLGQVLVKAGLSPSDVTILNLDVTAIIPAFEKGQVDGVHVWDPWMLRLEKLGGKLLATDASVDVRLPSGWLARTGWVEENPDAVARWIAAYEKGRVHMMKDRDRADAITAKKIEMDQAEVSEMLARDIFLTAAEQLEPDHMLSMDPATIAAGNGLALHLMAIAEYFKSIDRISNIPDMTKFINATPLKAAVSQ